MHRGSKISTAAACSPTPKECLTIAFSPPTKEKAKDTSGKSHLPRAPLTKNTSKAFSHLIIPSRGVFSPLPAAAKVVGENYQGGELEDTLLPLENDIFSSETKGLRIKHQKGLAGKRG